MRNEEYLKGQPVILDIRNGLQLESNFVISNAECCRCGEVMAALEAVSGGCMLCASPDFEREGFGARTMIICDQCEREFHVGCLKDAGKCELQSLPEGAQFPHHSYICTAGGPL